MDFDKLLKQASVKQKVAEKKHVQQKQQKDVAKKKEVEEKRKASAKLKDMKEAARKKQLEYKGLISPSTGLPTSSSAALPHSASGAPARPHPSSASQTSGPVVSGASVSQTTLSRRDRDRDKKREKTNHRSSSSGGGRGGDGCTTKPSPGSSGSLASSASLKQNRHSGRAAGGKHSLSANDTTSGKSSKSDTSRPGTSKLIPGSSSNGSKVSTSSHKMSTASKGTTPSSVKSKHKPVQMSNFEELMKTAKMNSSDKGTAAAMGGKSVAVGGRLGNDGGKLKEPPRTSMSPVGKSLLERNHSRLKNKRNFETMVKGNHPRESLDQTKCGKTGLSGSPSKSSDLVRRPLHNSSTTGPLNKSHSSDKRSSERRENGPKTTSALSSRGAPPSSSRGQSTSVALSSKDGGVRGSKATVPPLSSLTPQQIQKLKAARASGAVASSGPPPKKKKPVNPTAFYGSAAARILQRKGQPLLSHGGGSLKYTSSYVDEMLESWQLEGVNGVDDLYSDEGEEEDFIASDDEFIDDSEDCEDYSSAIRKIFGYDRTRYADYEDDDAAMESSFAQQEFEEIRSARIGRQEDEEDIRMEHQQLAKKRGKKPPKSAGTKQTKLSFR